MNILEVLLFKLFPSFKRRKIQNKWTKFLTILLNSLPEEYGEIKNQLTNSKFYGIGNNNSINYDYSQFYKLNFAFNGLVFYNISKSNSNNDFVIQGLKVFSTKTNDYENIDLLFAQGLLHGIKFYNKETRLDEYDIMRIDKNNVSKKKFFIPRYHGY